MLRNLATLFAAVLLTVAVQPASATLVIDGTATVAGSGTASVSGELATYDWTATPFAAYVDFTVDVGYDLYLTAFTSNGTLSDVSGYTLDLLDSAGGTATTRFTNETNFANSAPAPITGNTNLFGLTGATNGSNPVAYADAVNPVLAGLAPGSYRLGVYDSATPDFARATFRIAQVPEAATGLFWLAGTVGLVVRRRRG